MHLVIMKVTIVAEIASNWEGNVTKAKKLIKECKKAGADAVKFQVWRAIDLYDEKHPNWKEIKKSEPTFKNYFVPVRMADAPHVRYCRLTLNPFFFITSE
jgi:sialic acid synthase SpsE